MCALTLNRVQFFATSWTVARQASLSMGVFRKEYWSGLPRRPPGDLSKPGTEPTSTASHALQADVLSQSRLGNLLFHYSCIPHLPL